ncbi:MAG: hypothetical protein QF692_05535 [Alphaproteobacteria bacterium]|jgi:hypothetical protein|nr:hypothetical protein [Alphaproteobacteria bacterium]MDP7222708.1 hypothetical protein [Alphaproteobacteria bacterium]
MSIFGGGSPSLLGGMTVDLLSSARRYGSVSGIGLSSSARALNNQYLSQASSGLNSILSAGAGGDDAVENARKQILALQSRFADTEYVLPSRRGREVDEEA